MGRGAWPATASGVSKSWAQLSTHGHADVCAHTCVYTTASLLWTPSIAQITSMPLLIKVKQGEKCGLLIIELNFFYRLDFYLNGLKNQSIGDLINYFSFVSSLLLKHLVSNAHF